MVGAQAVYPFLTSFTGIVPRREGKVVRAEAQRLSRLVDAARAKRLVAKPRST